MNTRRIKQLFSSDLFLKYVICTILVILIAFYCNTFFTIGIYLGDRFLKKEVVGVDTHYMGNNADGSIHITVKGLKNKHKSSEVIYRLPNNIHTTYKVNFKDPSNWDLGIENIKDSNDKIIFEGEYKKDSNYMIDLEGNPLIDDSFFFFSNGITSNFKIPLKNIADFAYSSNITIRGQFEFLILAIILFLITWINIKYPLFFFRLEHYLDVKDPEPTDFYLKMQRMSCYIFTCLGILFLIAAIY